MQVDWEINAVAVKTRHGLADLEAKTAKRTKTSGCGQGTVFGDLMEDIDNVRLPAGATLAQSALYELLDKVRLHETIYKQAGAVHGCALATNQRRAPTSCSSSRMSAATTPSTRSPARCGSTAMDGGDKIFYTTGRLTSEMVIKAAQMGIPFLVSRSGLTQMGYEIAQKVGMTMIGRATDKHYLLFTGARALRRYARGSARSARAVMPPMTAARDASTDHRRRARGRPGPPDGRRRQGTRRARRARRWWPTCSSGCARRSSEMLINANRNADRYAAFGHPVFADAFGGFAGPLAGLHAGMAHAPRAHGRTVPCDSPFLPHDLVARLAAAFDAQPIDLAVARTFDQPHPVFSLVRRDVLPHLDAFLAGGGRKIDAWYASLRIAKSRSTTRPDAFRNINTAAELAANAGGQARGSYPNVA